MCVLFVPTQKQQQRILQEVRDEMQSQHRDLLAEHEQRMSEVTTSRDVLQSNLQQQREEFVKLQSAFEELSKVEQSLQGQTREYVTTVQSLTKEIQHIRQESASVQSSSMEEVFFLGAFSLCCCWLKHVVP